MKDIKNYLFIGGPGLLLGFLLMHAVQVMTLYPKPTAKTVIKYCELTENSRTKFKDAVLAEIKAQGFDHTPDMGCKT